MFIFTLCSRVAHPTLLTGLLESLNALRSHNPGWDYQLTDNENADLTVLDFTGYASLAALTEEEFLCINPAKAGKIVVLLSARQAVMARQLMQSHPCSLLCVDERQLRLRELVECSLKKRRYISPLFLRLREGEEQPPAAVHFTVAEKKVINGLRGGKSGVEMALEMFRSQKTISSHKRSIMQKLGATSDLELRKAIMGMQGQG